VIQLFRDQEFVRDRKADPLTLRAITQRRVVDFDRVAHANGQDLSGEKRLARGLFARRGVPVRGNGERAFIRGRLR
jgi:hypothetical protein